MVGLSLDRFAFSCSLISLMLFIVLDSSPLAPARASCVAVVDDDVAADASDSRRAALLLLAERLLWLLA